MKHLLIVLSLFALIASARAQNVPYRVVFDLTSRDTLDQKAVLRWIGEITAEHPDAKLEVVMYGKGYELVMPEKSAYLAQVKEVMKKDNVTFSVCSVAMKNNNIAKSQLLPGASTVPDGIYEILTKQHDQWGYIKVGH